MNSLHTYKNKNHHAEQRYVDNFGKDYPGKSNKSAIYLLTCSRDVDEQQEIHTPVHGGGSSGKDFLLGHCACDCNLLHAKLRRRQDTVGASDLLRKC